jgi:benzoyl-CoA reductase/2-hydroxyglutaryl-CoA dehydratase subunit BcrC/BadD/HgdB
VPNKKNPGSHDLWLTEVIAFKKVMEKLTGNKIIADRLARATKAINDRRRAFQRLYNTRKAWAGAHQR